MFDFLMRAYEARLVEVLQGSRYAELAAEDVQRVLDSVGVALGAATLAQGARDLLARLDDRPEIEALEATGEADRNNALPA